MEQLNQHFSNYYTKNKHDPIYSWENREFGYSLKKNVMKRHENWNHYELIKILKEGALDVYVSSSFYENPKSKPISEKKWTHGNLIFDIDAKDLKLDCLQEHGNLPCDKCIKACYEEYNKLQEKFTNLGIYNYTCYFSGNAGLHIECDKSKFNYILPTKRIKLVEYIEKDVKIDRMVTLDKSRIFRMPDTLSSKSGLLKMRTRNPYVDACVLSKEKILFNGKYPSFRLNGIKWSGNEDHVELPVYVAVYLACKGYGVIV